GKSLGEADAVVLPGVGSFNQAAKTLPMQKIRDAVDSGKPLLGVCLGLQLFFSKSQEGEGHGLSVFPGEVKKFRSTSGVKIPQIGWNTLTVRRGSELTEGLEEES